MYLGAEDFQAFIECSQLAPERSHNVFSTFRLRCENVAKVRPDNGILSTPRYVLTTLWQNVPTKRSYMHNLFET